MAYSLSADQVMDSRRLYSQDVNHLKPLRRFSHEQIDALLQVVVRGRKMYKQAHREYVLAEESEETKHAKRLLIEANLPLVLYVAGRYSRYRASRGIDPVDLVQEGNLGLMHAIQKYNPAEGHFSTYAVNWIRRYINRALIEQGNTIYIPEYKVGEIKHVERLRWRLRQEINEEPTVEMLALYSVGTTEQITTLLENAASQSVTSLDQPYQTEDDPTFLRDALEDESADTELDVMHQALREQIDELLYFLTPRERTVLRLRYGLHGDKGLSLPAIGKRLRVSHETVRRIEADALTKLEPLFRERQLDVYL